MAGDTLRELVKQRLAVAAEEILALVEKTLAEHSQWLEHEPQTQRLQGCAAVTPLCNQVPDPGPGGAVEEFQELGNIKREEKEELLTSPVSAPPAGSTSAKMDDTEHEMELKILEYHSESATNASTQTHLNIKNEGPLLPSHPLPSSIPNPSSPFPSSPLPSSIPNPSSPPPSFPIPSSIPNPSSPSPSSLHPSSSILDPSILIPSFAPPTVQIAKEKLQTENSPKPCNCSVCGLQLANRASLRHHSASHSSEELLKKRAAQKKPLCCSLCRRTFFTSFGLKMHMNMHKKEKMKRKRGRQPSVKVWPDVNRAENVAAKNTKALELYEVPIMGENQVDRNLKFTKPQIKNTGKQQAGKKLKGPDRNQTENTEKNALTKKTSEKVLESYEAPTAQEAKSMKGSKSSPENQVSQNLKSLKPLITKNLRVAVFRVDSVQMLASVGNKAERQSCEEKRHNMGTTKSIVPKVKEYPCPFCDQVYYTEFSLRHHKFTHKDDFRCSICFKRFKKRHSLQVHSYLEHKTPQTTKTFVSVKETQISQQLQIQKRLHGKLKFKHVPKQMTKFKCGWCYKEFIWEETLRAHMKLHLSDGHHDKCKSNPEKTKANEEKKTEETRLELEVKSHFEEQSSEETFTGSCSSSYSDSSTESSSVSGLVSGSESSSGSSSGSSLESSSQSKAGEKRFPCPHCEKVFKSRHGLAIHRFYHKGDLTCPFCDRRFKMKEERKEHIQTKHIKCRREDAHGLKVLASVQLFHCKRCPRSFWNKKDAVAHRPFHKTKSASKRKRLESKRSLFRCTSCSTVFRLESNWKEHLRNSHQSLSIPYKCSICGDKLWSRKRLWKHLKRHLHK